MKANRRVYCAVAAILGAQAAAANAAAPAEGTPAESDTGLALSEVVVTAQRREETIQNVPIQITALTAQTLSQLNISTFEDYLRSYQAAISTSTRPTWSVWKCSRARRGLCTAAMR